jgi:hypothetical protein
MLRLIEYAKAAFMDRWHLLVLGGATAAALIGPARDVSFPLIFAAELVFLGVIATNPRFQRSIDARAGAVDNERKQYEATQRFNKLYFGLDSEAQRLFKALRQRCEIINEVVPHEVDEHIDKMEDWQAQGVNKLLWVYLKLLHTRMNLARFLKSTDEAEFLEMEKRTRERLQSLEKENSETKEKMRHSLEDTLATIDTRKLNLAKARENFEYVGLELDRISTKVTALSELAVNRQDPALITTGVDEFAKSVETTEQTIGDLRAFTGLSAEDEEAPAIMERRMGERKQIRI